MPGVRVAMVRYGPRISVEASGLGSQVSIWLGPPDSQKRMTAFGSREAFGVDARSRKVSASVNPANPARPICKNQRREQTPIRSGSPGSKVFWMDCVRWRAAWEPGFFEFG